MTSIMAQDSIAARQPDLDGLDVLVLGVGESGLAAVELAAAHGGAITAVDRRPQELAEAASRRLAAVGAVLLDETQGSGRARNADLVIVSPGVRPDHPLVVAARAAARPVWSEVELASRYCRGRIVGVSGSNGKSTVTSMIGTILRSAGIAGGTGGNLAPPFAALLADDADDAVHAVELSSFQLASTETLRAAIAVIVNLSPDHLDWHGSYAAYGDAKARLLQMQGDADAAILNADDADSGRFQAFVRGRLFTFSTRGPVERGACLADGTLVLRTDTGEEALLPASELPVPGEHNVANALAAGLAARLAGVSAAAVARGLRQYRALPHRLEPVGEVGGVRYVNDSKATNLGAAVRALASFEAGRVWWIAGGRDKGADWASLLDGTAARAREILLIGEATGTIRAALGDAVPLRECSTLGTAVATAAAEASPGDVVLLAPGCASFDQYRNFEARGDDFRGLVRRLASEEHDG